MFNAKVGLSRTITVTIQVTATSPITRVTVASTVAAMKGTNLAVKSQASSPTSTVQTPP